MQQWTGWQDCTVIVVVLPKIYLKTVNKTIKKVKMYFTLQTKYIL